MTRSEERRTRRQAEVMRRAIAGFEEAIAEHPSVLPAGVHPEAHRLVLAGMVSMRDDLREQLGQLEAKVMSPNRDAGPMRLSGYQAAIVEAMSDPAVQVIVSHPVLRVTGIEDHAGGSWTATVAPVDALEGPTPRDRGWVTKLGE